MRLKRILSVLFFTVFSIIGYAQTDTTLQKLFKINYTLYKGHSVDSLVKVLPTGYTEIRILASHRADYGNALVVFYPNEVSVWMQVKQFKYMNPWLNKTNKSLPLTVTWNITLFKKEALAFTLVYKGALCCAGCEDAPRGTALRKY